MAKGKYTWADGNVYEGDWKNDKQDGQGKLQTANGSLSIMVILRIVSKMAKENLRVQVVVYMRVIGRRAVAVLSSENLRVQMVMYMRVIGRMVKNILSKDLKVGMMAFRSV